MAQADSVPRDEISVLIVDDHAAYARGLAMLLESIADDIKVIDVATSADQCLEKVRQHLPDLVLMDINLSGSSGIDATREIRHLFPVVKVVMLTISAEDHDIYEAMRLGAGGYLSKEVSEDELVTAIRMVASGQVVVAPFVAERLLADPEEPVLLSDLEKEILKCVGRGLENVEIGRQLNLSESTVKRILRNVIEKLHLQNRVQAAVYAANRGWA